VSSEAEAWDAELESLAAPATPSLLQSWAWGNVQSKAGWSVERVRLEGAMASVQLRGIGGVREAYVPRGPVPATAEAIQKLTEWARERKAARLRIEPDGPPELGPQLLSAGFTRTAPTQPERTRILPLGNPDSVLAAMDRKVRYNIRLAERKGVTVEEGRDSAELARQSAAVSKREAIDLPPIGYYDLLLELLPWCRTYVARHPDTNEALCAVLAARHSGRGYNLFAGRSGAHADLKANELAHWRAIRGCAEAGLNEYDLWGVPPAGAGPDHPWYGLGRFKEGLGGQTVAYAGAWELVLSRSGARLLSIEKSARSRVRGLRRNIS
jgi:lipid II:glycine glycyltransferase (peptidoglycan interpeptide bridge formation enzyme)